MAKAYIEVKHDIVIASNDYIILLLLIRISHKHQTNLRCNKSFKNTKAIEITITCKPHITSFNVDISQSSYVTKLVMAKANRVLAKR